MKTRKYIMALESISIRKMENQTQDFYEAVVVMSKRAKQVLNNRIAEQMMVSNEEVEMGVYDQIFEKNPDDYVIATGESHSVEEFLALATEYAELGDWHELVEIDHELRPTDIDDLVGDSSKAQKQLQWKPKMKFKDLVKNMVEHDLDYFKLRSDPINDYTG